MLVFSGSAGGLTATMAAALLAAHGYPSLALAYFKAPGLPQTLSSIPLEYFTSALEELRAQPGVDRNHVLVAGESRGGEAALLVGAHFLRAQGFAYPVTALRYRDAGHLIGGLTAYYGSLTDDALAGGTVAATQAAQADAHAKLLAFLASL